MVNSTARTRGKVTATTLFVVYRRYNLTRERKQMKSRLLKDLM